MYNSDICKFLELEEKYNLYNKKILNVNYWIYSRFFIWEKIQQVKFGLGDAHRKSRSEWISSFQIISGLLFNSFIKPKQFPKDIDLFILSHPRRVWNDGHYECCYTTSLALEYHKSIVGERPYLFHHEKPVKEKNIFYLDKIMVMGNLFYLLYRIFRKKHYKKLYKQLEKELNEVLNQINLIWNINIENHKIIKLISKKILICTEKRKLYEKLLIKLHPKIIVEVVSYVMDSMIINELAEKHNIPTIELQHGTMGREHIPYNYTQGHHIPQFPEYIFLFSDYWKKTSSLPINEKNIKVTGFPYFDKQMKKYPKQQHDKLSIIFISQGTIGHALSRFAVDLVNHLDMHKWTVFYKLHPGEFESWEKEYPWLNTSTIKVIGKNEKNIYELFSICDVQIGVYSTALFEGLGYGLHTLIYKIYHSELFEELCRTCYADFFTDIDECIDKLETIPYTKIKKGFWKENAFENMKKEINEILCKIS